MIKIPQLERGMRFLAMCSLVLSTALLPWSSAHAAFSHTSQSIVAEGMGFPFEDPWFSNYPNLKRLRLSSRPFDAIFANDAAWANTNETILGGARGRSGSPLVAGL